MSDFAINSKYYSVITDPISERDIIVEEPNVDSSDWSTEATLIFLGYNVDSQYLHAIRNRCSIDELLTFANEVRKYGGSNNMLSELIPSNPGNSHSCLIANALNFESEIDCPYDNWRMNIGSAEIVKAIGNGMGLEYYIHEEEVEHYNETTEDYEYETIEGDAGYVTLPEEIGLAAFAFDSYCDYELECFNSHSAIVSIENDIRGNLHKIPDNPEPTTIVQGSWIQI